MDDFNSKAQLEERKKLLISEYKLFTEGKHKTLINGIKRIEEISEDKVKEHEKLAKEEKYQINLYKECQYEQIANDYEKEKEEINDKMIRYIKFRFDLLNHLFPEAFKYFNSLGYKLDFGLNEIEKPIYKQITIEDNNECLLTKEEINNEITNINQLEYKSKLLYEEVLKLIDKKCELKNNNFPPIIGIVDNVSDKTFDLKLNEYESLQLSYNSMINGN